MDRCVRYEKTLSPEYINFEMSHNSLEKLRSSFQFFPEKLQRCHLAYLMSKQTYYNGKDPLFYDF